MIFGPGLPTKDLQQLKRGAFQSDRLMDPLTNTGVLQLPTFWGGINLMEMYGDFDELFPFCTVDGSEILNRLRCKTLEKS